MSLEVIGLGVGRTGTFSLKLALEQLGYPCHHMEEVDPFSPEQLALWTAAAAGRPVDWSRAYAGYSAAVDWPTAAFGDELLAAYPEARFLLTIRDPEDWYRSFSKTIYPLVDPTGNAPPALHPFNAMVRAVMRKTGFVVPSRRTELLEAYERHVRRIQNLVPAERLLVFDVAEGWEPLCAFLGKLVPDAPFPRTNATHQFWESVGDVMPPPIDV